MDTDNSEQNNKSQAQVQELLPPPKDNENKQKTNVERHSKHHNEEERVLHRAEKDNPELIPHLAQLSTFIGTQLIVLQHSRDKWTFSIPAIHAIHVSLCSD